jgi:hypothetical protein
LTGIKMRQLLWRIIWQFLNKLIMELSYNPEIPLLDVYPKELNMSMKQKLVH